MAFSPLSRFLFLPLCRSSLACGFGAASSFVLFVLLTLYMVLIRVRRYLFIYYTWEILSNHVFEDLRKMKPPNSKYRGKREKMLRLAKLQRKIDEATEEMRHITQDDQGRGPQHRELRQESPTNEDGWYDDLYHGNFAFDDTSPLAAELQATPWPPSYKHQQLPMYDGIPTRSISS
jgi:hypothetical protein